MGKSVLRPGRALGVGGLLIGDRAKSPFPLKANEELWAEVTVPPSGPPRPIQLAISNAAGFKPLVVR